MNGGPGASSLIFTELGPLLLNLRSFLGSRGKRTPVAAAQESVRLVNRGQPARVGAARGVGFSRCVVPQPCPIWSDTSSAAANPQVLLTFYAVHPAERRRGLIISGESYAGVYVPLLAQQVHEHNGIANARAIRPKGIMVGDSFGVAGGCGLDSLDVLLTVLEQGAPGVSRGTLTAARAACAGELDHSDYVRRVLGAARGARAPA